MIILLLILLYIILIIMTNKKEQFHNTFVNEFYTDRPTISSFNIKDKVEILLNPGECVYIPRNWHYIIRTAPETRAYSVWFNKYYNDIPYVLDEVLDIDMQNDVIDKIFADKNYTEVLEQYRNVTIYKENNGTTKTFCALDADYPHNRYVIDNIYRYLEVPQILTDVRLSKDNFNFWYTKESQESSLQKNNIDSIICVLNGQQRITLFNNQI